MLLAPSSLPPLPLSSVQVLDGVPSPLACCRACRAKGAGTANVWNFCASPGGCIYPLAGKRPINMKPGQCELRFNLGTSMAMGEQGGAACLPTGRAGRLALAAARAPRSWASDTRRIHVSRVCCTPPGAGGFPLSVVAKGPQARWVAGRLGGGKWTNANAWARDWSNMFIAPDAHCTLAVPVPGAHHWRRPHDGYGWVTAGL